MEPLPLGHAAPGSVGNKNFIIVCSIDITSLPSLPKWYFHKSCQPVLNNNQNAWFRFVFSLGSGWEIFVMRLITTVQCFIESEGTVHKDLLCN